MNKQKQLLNSCRSHVKLSSKHSRTFENNPSKHLPSFNGAVKKNNDLGNRVGSLHFLDLFAVGTENSFLMHKRLVKRMALNKVEEYMLY